MQLLLAETHKGGSLTWYKGFPTIFILTRMWKSPAYQSLNQIKFITYFTWRRVASTLHQQKHSQYTVAINKAFTAFDSAWTSIVWWKLLMYRTPLEHIRCLSSLIAHHFYSLIFTSFNHNDDQILQFIALRPKLPSNCWVKNHDFWVNCTFTQKWHIEFTVAHFLCHVTVMWTLKVELGSQFFHIWVTVLFKFKRGDTFGFQLHCL